MKNQRVHIGIFGRRNVGKSSFINALAGEDISIVSEQAGTTTDPVNKTMELGEVGPAVLIDTAGIDDIGEIGAKRIIATKKVIKKINLGILVITNSDFDSPEMEIVKDFEEYNIPFFIVHNKSDVNKINTDKKKGIELKAKTEIIEFSSVTKQNLNLVLEAAKKYMPDSVFNNPSILGDLVNPGDIIMLVTPVDAEAPMGRMILPQMQTVRDVLDNNCINIVLKETELELFFKKFDIKPKLIVTDSQAFKKVNSIVPKDIPLTGFSILFSRLKGDFKKYVEGTRHISDLKDGDTVLILESCSHHIITDDIGREKLPRWISEFTNKKINFDVVAGLDSVPKDIKEYSLVIQCGGCMLTRKQILNRIKLAADSNIPITNYGMAIAYTHGIFDIAME
ncbi:MAG: [FeFe] hydrogenase H-cluster maturation GTPase HydF, partial [bacterium]